MTQNKGRPWTERETQQLLNLADAKVVLSEMAEKMGRTKESCRVRLRLHNRWKYPDGTFDLSRFRGRYITKPNEGVQPLDVADIVNHNLDPAKGKVNPTVYAKKILGSRLVIKEGVLYLDGRLMAYGLAAVMYATNVELVKQGMEQILYNLEWKA